VGILITHSQQNDNQRQTEFTRALGVNVMAAQDPKEKELQEQNSVQTLIDMEWDIIHELNKKLKDPDLTVAEWTKAANALGYHMSNLNKMLNQKGQQEQFNEQNLGDFIKDVKPKIFRRVGRDFRIWTKRLSLRKF
jgi:hypothetical protein